jgi:hypothetical protein
VCLLLCGNSLAFDDSSKIRSFLETHCFDCHNAEGKEAALDLSALKYDPEDQASVARWIQIHDRVTSGEMPPKEADQPSKEERSAFVGQLHQQLDDDDRKRIARNGRSIQRRLNVDEYENAIRDLFNAPWLSLKGKFPADGEIAGYNKPSSALDLSHVQMERYLWAAELAIHEVMQQHLQQAIAPVKKRYHIRDQEEITTFFTGSVTFIPTNIDRRPIPVIGFEAQPDVRLLKAPLTVGPNNQETRDREALAFLSRYHEGFRPHWNQARVPATGLYRLRLCGYSLNVEPGQTSSANGKLSGSVNQDLVSRSNRNEPVKIFGLTNGDIYFGQRRPIGVELDLTPESAVHEIGPVWLLQNETLIIDPVRLFRAPPPQWKNTQNPWLTPDGAPAVALQWLELEGPLARDDSDAGRKLLFGDLEIKALAPVQTDLAATAWKPKPGEKIDGVARSLLREAGVDRPKPPPPIPYEVASQNPDRDAQRLLKEFMRRAYRRTIEEAEIDDFHKLVSSRIEAGSSFSQAMIAGYKAILSSPGFLLIEESPGPLKDEALATRLALFLWNSTPDARLRMLAAKGELLQPEILRAETDRMLSDVKSSRFLENFLDYWLDLRKRGDTEPSGTLYNDYLLDDYLLDSAISESRMFLRDLIDRNLPAKNVIDSDYTFLNERLARHYQIPGVVGVKMQRVSLPGDSVRGGFLTQAAVLKVTACGTTTSPVVRGKFMNERIMGVEIPKPPPAVPAVEPDIRGATTLRQQLEKHRTEVSCAGCHIKIDPPGFALESFDVMGGYREHYRGVDEKKPGVAGHGYDGVPFAFHQGPTVDASGAFSDGRKFQDIREFKRNLLQDESTLARNLARHLLIYATGATISYSDRSALDAVVKNTAASHYGVRAIIHEIVQSELFRNK